MEEQFEKQDTFLRKTIKGLPLDKPSREFHHNLMARIEAKRLALQFKPLIPKWVWLFIGIGLVFAIYWLYLNPSSSYFGDADLSMKDSLQWDEFWQGIQFSKTTVYAVGFLALFLIQVPFLKRLVEKRYQ